jgi:hypothetical protein
MALPSALQQRLASALAVVDEHDTQGARLIDDATRLWRRVGRLMEMTLIPGDIDTDALELGCYAMQLPLRNIKTLASGKLARPNLRDRSEQAAELLVVSFGSEIDEALLDHTTRLLHELPQRTPMLDEARLLADAVNLDDFGVIGLMNQAIQLARQGEGISPISEGCAKRELYGYWDARLKDGFHFDPIRDLARQRLDHARAVCKLLADELAEDQGRSPGKM